MNEDFCITLYRWKNEFFYVDNFYEIALRKAQGYPWVHAHVINGKPKEEIVYMTLVNSFIGNVGVQKLNQFRFELVEELDNPTMDEIEKHTGLTVKQIEQFFSINRCQKKDRGMLWGSMILRC